MIRQQWQLLEQTRPTSVREILDILLKNRGAGPTFLSCALKDLEPYLAMRGMDEGARLMARHLHAGHTPVQPQHARHRRA